MALGRRTRNLFTTPTGLPRHPYIINRQKKPDTKNVDILRYEKFKLNLHLYGDSVDTMILFWGDGAVRKWAVSLKP